MPGCGKSENAEAPEAHLRGLANRLPLFQVATKFACASTRTDHFPSVERGLSEYPAEKFHGGHQSG